MTALRTFGRRHIGITWYADWKSHVIDIEQNDEKDQMEVGSAPLKTKDGWLMFYSYIYNYFSPPAIFGVQAVLLDLNDPKKIVGEVKRPFLVPEEEYEYYGRVPHIVFPSGALIRKEEVYLYYGAADTVSCVAMLPLRRSSGAIGLYGSAAAHSV